MAADLDESLDMLRAARTGEPVHHAGRHFTVDGMRFPPRPVQHTIPIWAAGLPGKAVSRDGPAA